MPPAAAARMDSEAPCALKRADGPEAISCYGESNACLEYSCQNNGDLHKPYTRRAAAVGMSYFDFAGDPLDSFVKAREERALGDDLR